MFSHILSCICKTTSPQIAQHIFYSCSHIYYLASAKPPHLRLHNTSSIHVLTYIILHPYSDILFFFFFLWNFTSAETRCKISQFIFVICPFIWIFHQIHSICSFLLRCCIFEQWRLPSTRTNMPEASTRTNMPQDSTRTNMPEASTRTNMPEAFTRTNMPEDSTRTNMSEIACQVRA